MEYNWTMDGNNRYVAERDGGYWIADSRVSLDSIVYAFLNGQSAESIAQSFPVLNLEQVYGAIRLARSMAVETRRAHRLTGQPLPLLCQLRL